MSFNYALITELRQRESMLLSEFASRIGISAPYLSLIENGTRKPTLEVVENLVRVTKIPIGDWFTVEHLPDDQEIPPLARNDAHAVMDIKKRLNREHRERQKAEERLWELEQAKEHLQAEIRMRGRFEDIICMGSISKNAKLDRLKELALWSMEEGELSFDEIQRILKVERSIFKNWLEAGKQPYECPLADGGEILASSPGEAALCLCCFECEMSESGECLGHGDEKRPENIIELLDRLKANGVYDGVRQSQILEQYYGLSVSPHEIAQIRHRGKKHLSIRDDIYLLDIRKKK